MTSHDDETQALAESQAVLHSMESAAERLDVAVVLPRPDRLADPRLVPSEAVLTRRMQLARGTNLTPDLRVWEPSQQPGTVFQSLGFSTPVRGEPIDPGTVQSGAVQRLASLGGYIVYARRGSLPLDDFRAELGRDFVVSRDHRIFQQGSDAAEAGAPHAENHEWHELSGIAQARERKVSGNNVRFGLIDTGIDVDHVDFNRRLIPFLNVPYREDIPPIAGRRGFDASGHGSHVASIIAGRHVGVAPQGRLHVAAAAEGHSLTTHLRRIIRGIDWLYGTLSAGNNRAQPIIINLSLGFDTTAPSTEYAGDYDGALDSVLAAVDLMIDDNMLVVAAIGNDGEDRYRLPAGARNVLGVGAVDSEAQEVMHFSGNVSPDGAAGADHAGPDLVGFGEDVLGANSRNTAGDSLYARWSGTSQSAAYVSGIAGLYWSMDRRMTAHALRQLLLATTRGVPRYQSAKRWGAGLARFDPPPELIKIWEA
jgi:subtilisin family serine protease